MSDGKVILDGGSKDIFVQTEKLASTHLTPPSVTQLFLKLSEKYRVPPDILTADEAVEYLKTTLGGR
jgi:hypothetical protein